MERPPLFSCDRNEDLERLAFLFSNEDWAILIYSESFPEGDRILAELDDFPAILEVWIGDSDDWGYALYEKGNFTAGCTLHRDYAGLGSKPPATSEDTIKICQILGLENRLADVKKARRGWHVFADVPCERFCQAIGALPATLAAKDIEHWNDGRLESREAAGWRIEPFLFEKRKLLGDRPGGPILHALAVRSFSPEETRPRIDPEFVEQMRRKVQIMVWLLRPVGWVIAFPFFVSIWLQRLGFKPSAKTKPGQEIIRAILPGGTPWRSEGAFLINDRHGCRIRAPQPPEAKTWPRPITNVFFFLLDDIEVSCNAARPASVRQVFDLRPQQSVLIDECFLIGKFPARILAIDQSEKNRPSCYYFWFVELPRAIYQFMVFQKVRLPAEKLARITEIVKTFEIFSDVQEPDPA